MEAFKQFFLVLITLLIVGFVIGTAYLQHIDQELAWSILFIPEFVIIILWGMFIYEYYNEHG